MNKDTRLSDVLHVLLHMAQVKEPLTSEVLARSMGTNPAVFRRTMAVCVARATLFRARAMAGAGNSRGPLEEITLLAVYEALERPTLFAIGSRAGIRNARSKTPSIQPWRRRCGRRKACCWSGFGQVTLDQLMPSPREVLTQTCGR